MLRQNLVLKEPDISKDGWPEAMFPNSVHLHQTRVLSTCTDRVEEGAISPLSRRAVSANSWAEFVPGDCTSVQLRQFLMELFGKRKTSLLLALKLARSLRANRGHSSQDLVPVEIQSFHLRPDKGHELVFPESSEMQFRHLLVELFRQEADLVLMTREFSANTGTSREALLTTVSPVQVQPSPGCSDMAR